MRRVVLAAAACLLAAVPAAAADWSSLRTEHFLLIGDASPGTIKEVALRFERFRAAVTSAFPVLSDNRPGPPVVVVVFRDQRAYEPYQPRFNGRAVKVGGYFLGGQDVNYITLAADSGGEDFRSVYHEYTHLLLQRLAAHLSPWFNEGLAEYFSTFDANGNTARFGRPIQDHVDLLRDHQMKVSELFAVTRESATYNEGDRRSLFYAQSWLLMHYGFVEHPDRWKQLVQLEALLERGAAPDAAFQQAFASAPIALDQELLAYVRRPAMRVQVVELDQRAVTRLQAEPTRIAEAEAQARLADLLAHAGRNDEAIALLQNVVKTAPDLPLAHATLGTMLLRQDKGDEAMTHLERAASAPTADEFVHFYYGGALIERASLRSGGAADLQKGIAALERAVHLRAGFTDAERMLGYAYLMANDNAKAGDMLRRTLQDQPGAEDVTLMLAEAYLRLGQVADARGLLGPLLGRATEARTKERARDLLGRSVAVEQQQQVHTEAAAESTAAPAASTPDERPLTAPNRRASTVIPVFRDLQNGETRTYGLFTEIECAGQQIVVHLRTAGGAMLLKAARFEAIDFISYRSTAPGTISCGPRRPAEDVYVTWRHDEAAAPSGTQGTVVAVELLPDGFVPGQ